MTRSVFLSELSWVEYRRRLAEEDAIVMLPVGACEQHGPHLPLGTDAILATEMTRRAAERVAGIVAPTLSYGYKSQPRTGGGNHFCGTTSLDGGSLCLVVRDVLKELARHGARKLAVIDGHYENQMFLTEGADLAVRELRYDGVTDVRILKMRYCEAIRPETLARVFPHGFAGLDLEHAGVLETSMMLHLFPQLVQMEEVPADPPAAPPPYDVYPTDASWIPASGVLSPAGASTAESGRLLVEEFVELVVASLEAAFRTPAARPARRAS
ncbi:MAG: creatininase [Candidatus Rokuibacteriota bacterium]